ncbi:MAG TPA: sigma-70 family RNA polymerase sigma factor [Bacillota bacterium]|nr:sigma-70 family RNA polymerase sigma factor [Bacillota bacterium]HOK68947.1 sigma-70 family RNA polymerase sigma factor [Bacillota bacterium]HPP85267.1 sigma-70 family RNA polymerase sigma factor [Bacillota bacterium]
MKDYEQLFTQIADEYSLMLLNWAYKKLGDREKAEDLAQEVLVQVFSTIKKDIKAGKQVEKLENLVWKVAHYVWCHHLRRLKTYRMYVHVDELQISSDSDFVAEYAEKEHEKQLILRMRKQIARLSFLQREIMISFYLDKLTVKQIAEKLNISEQAVKWHLFDTRKN